MVVFHGFDLEDAESIRHLSVGLRFYNAGGRDFTKGPMLQSLNDLQRETIEYVVDNLMVRSPLLTKIIESFIDTSRLNDNVMLAAGRRLQRYAVVDSVEPGSEEYQNIVQAWESREPLPEPSGSANVGQHTPETQRLHLERLTAQGAEEYRLNHNRARRLDAMAGIEEDEDYWQKLHELRDAGYGPYVRGGVESDIDTSDEGTPNASKPKRKSRKTVRFKDPDRELEVADQLSRDEEPVGALHHTRYLAGRGDPAEPGLSSNSPLPGALRVTSTCSNLPLEIPDSENEEDALG